MIDSPVPSPEAYLLMQKGAEALSQVEQWGIKIDVDYLEKTKTETTQEIEALKAELKQSDVYRIWFKRFGKKTKLGSPKQLTAVVFEELGFTPTEFTDANLISADEKHLATVDHPFVKAYVKLKKLLKLRDTYVHGVLSEVSDGFLHPSFNLNLAQTYRSSSSAPNFQNIPIRNKAVARAIRRAFVPRDGHVLLEIDYGQIEVRVSACYHKDPTMIDYIVNKGDMHRDMAVELFMLKQNQIESNMRQVAKNSFVFAEFYGDYYPSVSKGVWEALKREKIQYNGESIFSHLERKGISELGACNPKVPSQPGTYEHHVKLVEKNFWEVRFPVYKKWKEEWHAAYTKRGWFKTLTGFVGRGVYKRNEVINSPIQGSAFHCLLWSLIQLVNHVRKHKLKSRVVGQIHDSLIMDVHESELAELGPLIQHVMTDMLRAEWSWIIVPLEVDASICVENWFEKKGYNLNG